MDNLLRNDRVEDVDPAFCRSKMKTNDFRIRYFLNWRINSTTVDTRSTVLHAQSYATGYKSCICKRLRGLRASSQGRARHRACDINTPSHRHDIVTIYFNYSIYIRKQEILWRMMKELLIFSTFVRAVLKNFSSLMRQHQLTSPSFFAPSESDKSVFNNK